MGYPYGPESYPTIEMCEGKDVVDRISVVYGYECSKAEERKRREAMDRCGDDDCYIDTELTFAEQMKALGEAIGYVCDIDDCYDNRFITDLFNVLEDGVIGESDRQSINDYEIKDAAAGYARAKLDLTYPDKLGEYAKRLAGEDRGREEEERRKLIDETVEIMRRNRTEYVERATVRLVGALVAIGVDEGRVKELVDGIVNETIDGIDVDSPLVANECEYYAQCRRGGDGDRSDAAESDGDSDAAGCEQNQASDVASYAKQVACNVIDAADAAAAKVESGVREYVESRRGKSVEELIDMQRSDLERIRDVASENIDKAKKMAFNRLHDAGIIDDDGKLTEPYQDKVNAARDKACEFGGSALDVAGSAVSKAGDVIERLRTDLNGDGGSENEMTDVGDGVSDVKQPDDSICDERSASDVDNAASKLDGIDDIVGR